MNKLFCYLLALVFTTCHANASIFDGVNSNHNLYTHTQNSLKLEPASSYLSANVLLQLEFIPHTNKLAAAHWLPDFQESFNSRTNSGGSKDKDIICSDYEGGLASCPSPKTGKKILGTNCVKDCKCPVSYKYTDAKCQTDYGTGYKAGPNLCDGKANSCVAKPCTSGSTTKPTCTKGYEADEIGVSGGDKCYASACKKSLCVLPLTTSNSCPSGFKAVDSGERSGTEICYRCDVQTCAEKCSGYVSGQTCAKGQTPANCGSGCETFIKCNGSACPTHLACTQYGCKTYSKQTGCTDVCTECKTCTPTTDETGCTNGTTDVNNGCGGTYKKCNAPCVPVRPDSSFIEGYGSCKPGDDLVTSSDGCGKPYHKCINNCQDKIMKVNIYAGEECGSNTIFSGETKSTYCDGSVTTGSISCDTACNETDFSNPYGPSGGNDSETITRNLTEVTLSGLSSNVLSIESYTNKTIMQVQNGSVTFTTADINGNKDYWTLRCNGGTTPASVPLAFVEETYRIISGGYPYQYQDYYRIFSEQFNTKLYTSYNNPEFRGFTGRGVDYRLRGSNDQTSLTFYYNPNPTAYFPEYSYGSAHCRVTAIKRNGTNLSFKNDSYQMISRSVGEEEITVFIDYECQIY